jgi:hypothetical protein
VGPLALGRDVLSPNSWRTNAVASTGYRIARAKQENAVGRP